MPQTVGQANVKAAARAKLMIFAEEAASRWRERAERAEAELAKVTAELEVCSLAREVHVKRGVELEAEVERLRKELADYKRTIAYIEPRIDKMLAVLKGGGQQEGS